MFGCGLLDKFANCAENIVQECGCVIEVEGKRVDTPGSEE